MSSLFAFVQALRKKSSESPPPLTEHGIEVVNPIFDPYRSCFFSPDHLLSGLAINILNTIFRLLHSAEPRTYADNPICDALKSNGLIEQQQLYSMKNNALHSMSLSGVFCVLLFSHASFTQAIVRACNQGYSTAESEPLTLAMQILQQFSELVSQTYWFPSLLVDGLSATELYKLHDGRHFIGKLLHSAKSYLEQLNELCRLSDIARKELDKPNLHRLLR